MTKEELAAWLDRKPNTTAKVWPHWFKNGVFLGKTSARTGPDQVNAEQPCPCEACHAGRKQIQGR